MCIAITAYGSKCLISPTRSYCVIHANLRIVSLEAKIENQRNELTILNDRCRNAAKKLKAVNRIDYLKSRMRPICSNRGFRALITDHDFSREVEAIFNLPFDQCLQEYDTLLALRNAVVHPYEKKNWPSLIYKRQIHHKTLSELAKFAC